MKRAMPVLDEAGRRLAITYALSNLRCARDHLIQAGAPQSLAKVRSALKSVEGAQRHAIGRDLRADVLNVQRAAEELEQPDRMVVVGERRYEYDVSCDYRTHAGNCCTARAVIVARSTDEAAETLRLRVKAYKRTAKIDGGMVVLLRPV